MNVLTRLEKPGNFYKSLLFICGTYLLYQFFYNAYTILGVDDFALSHATYEYVQGLPYRDFAPYKTVMGNYLLMLPLLFSKGHWLPLIYIKDLLALINASAFFGAAILLKRHFSKLSVLASLLLLIGAEMTLSNSTNIRTDLLAYWLCLFSVLMVLDNHFILGGILLGLGFTVSQKVLWYVFASDAALGLYWIFFARNRIYFREIVVFNLAALATILAYLLIWSGLSSPATVLKSVFYEAYVMYKLDYYDRLYYWWTILYCNSLLFLLWPLTLLSLFVAPQQDRHYKKRFFVIVYASVIMLCLLPYKQVFPYYMLTLLPALLLLYAGFFNWLQDLLTRDRVIQFKWLGKQAVWTFLVLYSAAIVEVQFLFHVPGGYLLLLMLPLGLAAYLCYPEYFKQAARRELLITLLVLTLAFTGLIYPLCTVLGTLPLRASAYQKSVLGLMDALLQDGSDYVAGVELYYNKNQPIAGLRQLEMPAIEYLRTQDQKFRPFMSMASLYHTPDVSTQSIIEALKKSKVKLYINNYRMQELPGDLRAYLQSQYQHYWGSLYLYAPQIVAGKQELDLKFSGHYLLESSGPIQLDGKTYANLSELDLNEGSHYSYSRLGFRLKLQPQEVQKLLYPAYQADDWERML